MSLQQQPDGAAPNPQGASAQARRGRGAMLAVVLTALLALILVVVLVWMTAGSDDDAAADDSDSEADNEADDSEPDDSPDFDGVYRMVLDGPGLCLGLSPQGEDSDLDRHVLAARDCEDDLTDFVVEGSVDDYVLIGFGHESWNDLCLAPDGPDYDDLDDADPEAIWYVAPYECDYEGAVFQFTLDPIEGDEYRLMTAAEQCVQMSSEDEFEEGNVMYTAECADEVNQTIRIEEF